MALLLRFTSVKCPRRTISCIKRFCWTSHSFRFREGLGIRYFIPRTANIPVDIRTKRIKDQDSMPEEFKVIYNFPHANALKSFSYAALGFAVILIFILFNSKYLKGLAKCKKKEENELISKDIILQDYTSSVTTEKIKTLLDSALENEALSSGDPKAKSVVGLTFIIFFFYIRSRCVLKIYRHNNDFVTVLYQALGFGKKFIQHRANDCCYYPKRKWLNYNLMGKNVIILSELFINFEEEQLYTGRTSQ